jgi:alpha-glucosidase
VIKDDAQPQTLALSPAPRTDPTWWRHAAIYQIYVRSFADSNGDGIGDLGGVREKLPYLAELGVDAIWFTPWYESPLKDGGYDVADYRRINPQFGSVDEAEALIREALELGIRTIIDVVPNHVSHHHAWFQEALAAEPGSPARDRFWFRDGRGTSGEIMPNDWPSNFSGDTWTRTTNADGTPGQWYLHLFTPEQPDLNWNHPDVRREHEDVLKFWFDRGVGGVRIDSAALVVKDPALPEIDESIRYAAGEHPNVDRDELHDIYRSWRAVADSYEGTRVLVGEIWLPDLERFALYLRPDELHTAFNFDFMNRPWSAAELRQAITGTLAAHAPVGAPATWVLSNHDITRPVTRYGRADSSFDFTKKRFGTPTDLGLGTRRARAAALLTAALPGSLYLYQGDELGLPEVEDIPLDRLDDPMHFRSAGVDPGRDGCRVPLPWSGTSAPYGFSPSGSVAEPWLPQPTTFRDLTVAHQEDDPDSMLSLYRRALRIRATEPAFVGEEFAWLSGEGGERSGAAGTDAAAAALLFRRGADVVVATNLSAVPVSLPPHSAVLLASGPLVDGRLPADTTVWLRI